MLFGLLFSWFIFLSFWNLTFSQTVTTNWEDAKWCMAFSRTVNTFLKENPDAKEVDYEDVIVELPVDEWLSNDGSDTYFSYYDEKDRIITVVKGSKNADSSAINFDLAKKIAKLSVPKNFSKMETRFLDNDYLIITTELQWKEKETLVLVYSIKNDKLTPVQYFKQTWKSVLVHLQWKKLYVISVAPLSKTDAQNFVKKDWDLWTIFPKLESWVKYWEIVTENKVSRCQDYKYYFPRNWKMPEFWSFTVMDLSNTQFPKQHLFFLWRFLQFKFANDFLYATSESEDGSTAIEKFWLAPKLNYQKINQLSWEVLDNWIIVNWVDSAYITKLSSWKMKSYRFTSFDERFWKLEEVELANWNDEYSLVQQLWWNIVVQGKDDPIILWEWKNWKVIKKNVVLSWNGNFYLHSDSPLKFLVVQTEGKIKLSFYEERGGNLDKVKTYYYSWFTTLLGDPSWNKKNSTLLLPIKVSAFDGLRALNCSNPNKLKEIWARSYKDASFKAIGQLKYFAYAVTENLIDIFLSNKSTSMKLLRLK